MKHTQRLLAIAGLIAACIVHQPLELSNLGEATPRSELEVVGRIETQRSRSPGLHGENAVDRPSARRTAALTDWTQNTAGAVLDSYGIYGADADQKSNILAAMGTFTDAGLSLPPLRIYVHDSPARCEGHMGLYSFGGDKHRVDICMAYPAVIRHELAHAWEHHNLDDWSRRAFQQRVGTKEWNDQDAPFPVRAMERAAYLIAWGLDSRPIQFISSGRYRDDLESYELLTGRPSPRISHWDDAPVAPRPTTAVMTDLPVAAFEPNSKRS